MNDLSILSFEQGQSALLQLDLNLQRDFRFKFLSVADQGDVKECSRSNASPGIRFDLTSPGGILVDLLQRLFPEIPVLLGAIFNLADYEFRTGRNLGLCGIGNIDEIVIGLKSEGAFLVLDDCRSDNCCVCILYR